MKYFRYRLFDETPDLSAPLSSLVGANPLNDYAQEIRANNDHFWHDLVTGEKLPRDITKKLMLIVSELAEAMEGDRKNLMDDHLPNRKMFDCEIADAFIRLFDLAGEYIPDLEEIINEKREYNAHLADHKTENRLSQGGKKY